MATMAPPAMETSAGSANAERSGPWQDPLPWVELFAELATGHSEALARLYDLASGRLYGLALWRTGKPEDAEEVVQEAFVRIATLRKRLGTVRDPRWWLLALTHRLAVDVTRRRQRRRAEPLDAHPHLAEAPVDPARTVDAERAWALLARVSPKQREVIYLHHDSGMSHAEIGRFLGIPAFTAASRYRLGLRAIRLLLEEKL
jgi:RNA polymerase sigma-70 factor (ECF subfamily)